MNPDTPAGTRPPGREDPWIVRLFSGLGADLRFALRMLAKNKGFAATALVTLALCVGANTAIFSMLYALVIKPLPYQEPARIVEVTNSFAKVGLNKLPSNIVQYLDFKEHAPAFEEMALWQGTEMTLGDETRPVRVTGVMATAGIFRVLAVQPLAGRFFTSENQMPAADKVVVLAPSFWESQFHSDPAAIGRTMRLDGESYEIIGVAPHDFEAFDARVRFVRPLSWAPDRVGSRYGVTPQLFGRLKAGSTVAEALGQVAGLEKAVYDKGDPGLKEFLDRSGHKIGVDTVQAQRVEPVKTSLYLLQGSVLFVLLIGCVNVANLLLARSNARQGELAIRSALGAGRGVIARQLIMESTLLTWMGAAIGLGLAWVALGAVNHYSARLLPNALPFVIDGRVLGYTAVLAAAMSLAIGTLPVVHVLGGDLLGVIQSRSRSTSSGHGVRTLSSALVVAQVAFALMLLTGAGLLIHSFANAVSINPGFDPRGVVAARVALNASYFKDDKAAAFQKRLLSALQEIPGVTVSTATATPYETGLPINAFGIRDHPLAPGASQPGAFHLGASPAYLEVLRIPLIKGRWFNETDTAKSRKVYVVDENFEKKFFPGQSAVGQGVSFGQVAKPEDWPEIVGVVGNVRHNGVEEVSGNPFLYHPMEQTSPSQLSVLVRSQRPLADTMSLVRAKIAAIDPALPVFQADTMGNVISTRLNNRRAIMLLLVSFAAIALLLSAIGTYGVLAYDVSQRTREIGIRGAIGASSGQVVALILKQGLWKTGTGLVIGIAGALVLSHFMAAMLYDVKPTDPLAYVVVTLLLLGVAVLASYIPARRASRIDPVVALRSE